MKPVLNGPTYGVNPRLYSSPYLEKTIKKYTPRFYVERYGIPKTSKIHAHGLSITVPFVCLRDYQEDIVETYINHSRPICSRPAAGAGGGLLMATGPSWR
jgi:hypothetical protein